MSCGHETTRPVDNPLEFSRLPRSVEPCVSSEGVAAALPETDVGPAALARFLGPPSRTTVA